MKNKKTKQPINFETTHQPNKYRGNKNIIVIISVVAFVVIVVGIVVSIFGSKANEGKINYTEYTTLTAKAGEEYTYVDENGNEYDVKEDGMYCQTDFGYIKVEYNEPLPKYNAYSYILPSGACFEFNLNKDNTYTYTATYADGTGFTASGDYTFQFGTKPAFAALQITDKQEFSDAFLFASEALNPNDLFVVTLNKDKITYFDATGAEVTYNQENAGNTFDDFLEETSSVRQPSSSVLDELVVYLYVDEEGVTRACAYDTVSQLLFNENNINGQISVATE